MAMRTADGTHVGCNERSELHRGNESVQFAALIAPYGNRPMGPLTARAQG